MKFRTELMRRVAEETLSGINTVLRDIVPRVPGTDDAAAGMLVALLSTASALAIRFDVKHEAFFRLARDAWAYAQHETRQVDAEDDN